MRASETRGRAARSLTSARAEIKQRSEAARRRRLWRREAARTVTADEVAVMPASLMKARIVKITPGSEVTVTDLRDEVIGALKRAGVSFIEAERRGGPKAQTLSKWAAKEAANPRLLTMRKALNVIDADIQISL